MSDDQSYSHHIDGSPTESTGSKTLDVSNPYTGETWGAAPDGTAADVGAAIDAASRRFESEEWQSLGAAGRRRLLHEIADIADEYADELATLETRQNGKLLREMSTQTAVLGEWFRYYAGLCETPTGETIPTPNKEGSFRTYTTTEPYGVVGMVTPWNSPLLLSAFKLAPAIATGNTVVHKPSEHTPVSALRFAELLSERTALPDGVYNVVIGGPDTGRALVDHDGIAKVAFTGSTAAGREIARNAGENLTPVTLELGGKSPNVVFSDVDLDDTTNGLVKGIFAASGQTCLAGSRILVHESIEEEITSRLVARAASVELGDPTESNTQMGPLAFPEQREKVLEYIEQAEADGATVAYGGRHREDLPGTCFVEPTVLTDVTNDMPIAQEEIFGPVACIIPFADEAEAVEIANDTRYGLAAGIWTENVHRAHRVADELEAGTIWINEYRTLSYAAPFGGHKDSGLGSENGIEGLEEYRQTKTVWVDTEGKVSNPFNIG